MGISERDSRRELVARSPFFVVTATNLDAVLAWMNRDAIEVSMDQNLLLVEKRR